MDRVVGKPYEIAEENNLLFCYHYHNNNANGKVTFWKGNESATFVVVSESGEYESWQQTLELVDGTWPL